MIETTIGHIRSREFGEAWSRVLAQPFGGEVRYKIVKMEKAIKAELEPVLQVMEEIAKRLGEMDPVTKNYNIKEENREEWGKEVAKLHEQVVKIDKPKLLMSDLEKVQLSTMNIISLEFMLNPLELIDGGPHEEKIS